MARLPELLPPVVGVVANGRRRRARAPVDLLAVGARLLRDHSIPLAILLSIAMVTFAVVDVDRALCGAGRQRLASDTTLASLAVHEAIVLMARDGNRDERRLLTSWGKPVQVQRGGGDTFSLVVDCGRERFRFGGEWLAGAAPACFAVPLTIGASAEHRAAASWLAEPTRVGPQPSISVGVGALDPLPGMVVDGEIAFLHVPSGTDRTDYRWGSGVTSVVIRTRQDVVEVAGNLWIAPAATPLAIHLARPLTVLVRGNLYLARSLSVTGIGPLTFVAQRHGASFRDLDGDGVASGPEPVLPGAGPAQIEGDGSIYLGLPRARAAVPLQVAAQLVATGEVHVLVDATLHAALVSAHSVTRCLPRASLTFRPTQLLDPERTRIPGFAVSGGPRPSRVLPEAAAAW